MENKKTTLVVAEGGNFGSDVVAHLIVLETGEVLASHICSDMAFAKGDLHDHRPERIPGFKERFGEYEVKYLHETDVTEEELMRRNKAWFAAQPKEPVEKT